MLEKTQGQQLVNWRESALFDFPISFMVSFYGNSLK